MGTDNSSPARPGTAKDENKPEGSGAPLFERVALIGLGLIGSSLCLAMRRRGLARIITGSARTQETIATAVGLGLVDEGYHEARDAAAGADLIILCVPVSVCGPLMRQISDVISPGAIITDVGSTKMSVIRDMAPHVPDHAHFIPGHPIAGAETSGPEAGFTELFDNRWCILTPPENTNPDALEKLQSYWRGCGSMVEIMAPDHHDLVLAITSHLPHLIAYNIVGTAADLEYVRKREVIKFSAGGFRDFTRIAASDPIMWRDVFLNNKSAVLEMLQHFNKDLAKLQTAIENDDGDMLQSFFTRTREIRRGIIDAHQDTAAPDFGRHAVAQPDAGNSPDTDMSDDDGNDGGDESGGNNDLTGA